MEPRAALVTMRAVLTLAAGALALAPTAARAAEPPIALHLAYRVEEGAGPCPAADTLHRELARRLGYDPFTMAEDGQAPSTAAPPGVASGRIAVVIAPSRGGLTARYTHFDLAGRPRWTREYPVPGAGARACEGAIEGVAVDLAAEIAILSRRSRPRPPSSDEVMPPPLPAAAPPPRSMPVQIEVGLAALITAGAAPAATAGGSIHLGVAVSPWGESRAWLSFAVEGRADKPAGDAARAVSADLLGVALLACGHKPIGAVKAASLALSGCLTGAAARLRTTVERGSEVHRPSGLLAAVGPRFALEARLPEGLTLAAFGEALPVVHPVRVRAAPGFHTAAVTGGAGVALRVRF